MAKNRNNQKANEPLSNANIRDYFETDAQSRVFRNNHLMSVDSDDNLKVNLNQISVPFSHRLYFDYEANSIYSSFFIPELPPEINLYLLCRNLIDKFVADPLYAAPPVLRSNSVNFRDNDVDLFQKTSEMVNSRLLKFYIDMEVNTKMKNKIADYATQQLAVVKIRDRKYARRKAEEERPYAFISHDSRDKDTVARPLAQALANKLGRVWFDEFSLKPGDHLRESIEKGIKECHRCILILSPNFLANSGWSKKEFNSVFAREMTKRERITIPVWVNVSEEDVYDYSPDLVNTLAINWNEGVEAVAEKIRMSVISSIK